MDFRSPTAAVQENARAMAYLTRNLSDPSAGRQLVDDLVEELGNAVNRYPDWHPILTAPPRERSEHVAGISQIKAYAGVDHTTEFVRGFVTCPYSADKADRLVATVGQVAGLNARRLDGPLYAENVEVCVSGNRLCCAWCLVRASGKLVAIFENGDGFDRKAVELAQRAQGRTLISSARPL